MANLFSDGFESGNFSAWDATALDGGNLSVAAAAAMHGSYGLNVLVNNTNAKWARKDFASPNTRFRCRFYLNPHSLTMANNDAFLLTDGYNAAWNVTPFQTFLQRSGGAYYIWVQDGTDGAFSKASSWHVINDEPCCIEIDWKAATAPLANDGTFTLWIDGILKQTVTAIDSDTEEVSHIYLGATGQLDAGTSGTFYLDDFKCNNDGGYIGGLFPTPTIALPGLGFNVASSVDTTIFDAHVAALLNIGITGIRVNLADWANAGAVAQAKAAALRAIAVGANVIWGVSSPSTTLTSSNWANFSAAVQDAATWAQANGVFEFQIGNEETLHNDGTTLTDATLITNLKALATTVQGIFTRGNVSYSTEAARISDWITAGKGDLDVLAANIYIGGAGTYAGVQWETDITNLKNAFGATGTYLTEFNISYTSLADYSSDERVQALQLSKMIEYIRASGITRALYYAYSDATANGFGALKTTGIYRHLWQLMNFPSGRQRLTSTLGGISRTQSANRNVAIDLAQAITPGLGSELLGNPGFETAGAGGADIWGSWIENAATGVLADEGSIVHSGSHAAKETQGAGLNLELYQNAVVVASKWYQCSFWCRGDGTNSPRFTILNPSEGGTLGGSDTQSAGVPGAAYALVTRTFRTPGATTSIRLYLKPDQVNGAIAYYDDASIKPLTLSSLIGAIQTALSQGTFQRPVTVAAGYQAGFWLNWDGNTDGTEDYVEAIVDRATGQARLSKCVAGTVSNNLVSGTITYVAGALLKVVRDGSLYSLYYNGVLVGSAIITDGGVIGNTGFAAFQTDPTASGNIQYIYPTRTAAGARTAIY